MYTDLLMIHLLFLLIHNDHLFANILALIDTQQLKKYVSRVLKFIC